MVAAKVGGLREIVADGETGILVAGHQPAQWATALGGLLTEPGLRTRMSDAAAAQSRRFTWQQTAARTLESYENVLKSR